MTEEKNLITQSFRLGILLAFAGGFMDAYSYLCRDQVFANAQTGNIVLFSVHLFSGDFKAATKYLIPILAAIFGILVASLIRNDKKIKNIFHWHQIALLIEAFSILPVYFLSPKYNTLANILISFVCGIQMEAFKKIRNKAVATTMCTGNLRSGTEEMQNFLRTKNKKNLYTSFIYYGIILCFIAGAMLGKFVIDLIDLKAIIVCFVLFILAFLVLFFDKDSILQNERIVE